MTMFGSAGTPASARAGTSAALPHHPPLHTGRSGSPASNWIQTPAPTWGAMKVPIWLPARGRLGIAQVVGVMPPASGTIAIMRPICSGSILLKTVPR